MAQQNVNPDSVTPSAHPRPGSSEVQTIVDDMKLVHPFDEHANITDRAAQLAPDSKRVAQPDTVKGSLNEASAGTARDPNRG